MTGAVDAAFGVDVLVERRTTLLTVRSVRVVTTVDTVSSVAGPRVEILVEVALVGLAAAVACYTHTHTHRSTINIHTRALGWEGMGCAGNSMYINLDIHTLSYHAAQSIPSQRVCECTFRPDLHCFDLLWIRCTTNNFVYIAHLSTFHSTELLIRFTIFRQ